jgi:ABC-type branched-subunit amino acid transport system substrate-binding protein
MNPSMNQGLLIFAFLCVPALAGCSTDFSPSSCQTDADCGDGLVCAQATCAQATTAPLRIGMSAAASGPSQDLGTEMKRGISLAFQAQNEAGGVRGRPVMLDFRDDEYRPDLAQQNADGLLDVKPGNGPPRCPTTTTPPVAGQDPFSSTVLDRGPDAVLAVLGNVGTPTMVRFAPIAVETQTLFFGAFTGAKAMLRDDKAGPCARYIFNVRASYGQEAHATLEFFMSRGITDWRHLVSFDQNDSFGQAGYDGLTAAYAAIEGLTPLPAGETIARFRYTRDDLSSIPAQVDATADYIQDILGTDALPHVVGIFMTDTYGPATQFITEMRDWHYGDPDRAQRLTMLFSNVSFVGPNSLASRLKDAGTVNTGGSGTKPYTDGVFISQVVPNYEQDSSDTVLEYKKLIASEGAAPNFTSLEGYIAARVFLAGLIEHQGDFSSEGLISTFENLPELTLGLGATSGFSPETHDYSKSVWGTAITSTGTFQNVYYWREGTPISFFE